MSSSPNRKPQRIARALAESQGIPYQQALTLVLASMPSPGGPARDEGLIPVAYATHPANGLIPIGQRKGAALGIRCADLDSHLLLTGQPGTGRTELLKWMVLGAAHAGTAVMVVDQRGDLTEETLDVLLAHCPGRLSDIIVCDFTDAEHPVVFNPLDVPERLSPDVSVRAVAAALADGAAPRAQHLIAQAAAALIEANRSLPPGSRAGLMELSTFFTDVEFRRLLMAFCTNPGVVETFDPETGWFEICSEREQAAIMSPVRTQLERLAASSASATFRSAGADCLHLSQLIRDQPILLVRLPRSHAAPLGRLLLNELVAHMDDWGRRQDPVTKQLRGASLRCFIDDAPSLLTPESGLVELLAETRKWDAGFILASRTVDEYDDQTRRCLLANVASKITFRTDSATASDLAPHFGQIDPQQITDLADYELLISALVPAVKGRRIQQSRLDSLASIGIPTAATNARPPAIARSRALLSPGSARSSQTVESIKALLIARVQEQFTEERDAQSGQWGGW